jgi:hypothetical protein
VSGSIALALDGESHEAECIGRPPNLPYSDEPL